MLDRSMEGAEVPQDEQTRKRRPMVKGDIKEYQELSEGQENEDEEREETESQSESLVMLTRLSAKTKAPNHAEP